MSINKDIHYLLCDILSNCNNRNHTNKLKTLSNEQWNKLIKFAVSNNLIALFYAKLHHNKLIHCVPKGILYFLKNSYNSFSCITISRLHEFRKVLKLFNLKGIDIIPLKGIYTSETLYDNPAERIMCDIDLLLRKSDIEKINIIELLEGIGCTAAKNFKLEIYDKFTRHLPVIKTPGGASLELHWKLKSNINDYLKVEIDYNEIWECAEEITINGQKCLKMKPEHFLLHTCVHISENLFKQKLLQLYDVKLIIEKENIDWNFLIETAIKWNSVKPLYGALLAAAKIYKTKIDENSLLKLQKLSGEENVLPTIEKCLFEELNSFNTKHERLVDILNNMTFVEKIKYTLWTSFNLERLQYMYGYEKITPLSFITLRLKRIIELFSRYLKEIFYLITNPSKRKKTAQKQLMSKNALRHWLKN